MKVSTTTETLAKTSIVLALMGRKSTVGIAGNPVRVFGAFWAYLVADEEDHLKPGGNGDDLR
ncbi:MAG TPA: hypothetical protein VJZ75_05350 [Candidatus Bathyarchaeia archaeon]|nr:hypothetical protein [Candidatus Bathyarchaeia archaeon]